MERKSVNLLGFEIDSFNFEQAVDYAMELITMRKGGQIITINPEMIETALINKDFAQLIKNAELVIPDGIGIKIGLALKGKKVQRIAGIEFAYFLLKKCEEQKIPVAMVGARPHILSTASNNIKNDMKDLKLVYTHNGYFSDEERVLKEIKQKSPRLVLVALGSPRQEYFIKKLREILASALMIGVGGSFDVWSGQVQRAPEIYQKLGLEWLYRTIKEPARFKRIFPTLPKFLLHVIKSNQLL